MNVYNQQCFNYHFCKRNMQTYKIQLAMFFKKIILS